MIVWLALALLQGAPIGPDNASRVKQIATLKGHEMPVFGLAVSADGKWLASAGIDKTVRVWNLAEERQARLFSHERQAIAVAFRPDGSTIVSAGYEPTIRTWDFTSGKAVDLQKESTTKDQYLQIRTVNVHFSPDGSLLASTLEGSCQVFLWDVKTRAQKELMTVRDATEVFSRVAFSADGKWMAAQHEMPRGGKSTIEMWNLKDEKWTGTLAGPDKVCYSNEAIALNADGTKAACVDVRTSDIHMWDVKSGKPGPALRGHKHDSNEQLLILSLAFNADSTVIASASYDETLRLWEVATGKQLAELPVPKGGAASAVFSPDGRMIATAGLNGSIQIWGVR